MSCNKEDPCAGKVIQRDLCWIAGTDEEFIYNLKYRDEDGVAKVTDITGYTSTLEIRTKATDVTPVLSIAATLDIVQGKFLFLVSDVETLSLLTKTRLNLYKFKVVEVNSLGKIRVRIEGSLRVRL